jgi:hypothetical protein
MATRRALRDEIVASGAENTDLAQRHEPAARPVANESPFASLSRSTRLFDRSTFFSGLRTEKAYAFPPHDWLPCGCSFRTSFPEKMPMAPPVPNKYTTENTSLPSSGEITHVDT